MTIPLPVLQFALIDTICLAKGNGSITPAHPIAWHETADEWVIVYEDGRKLRHSKSEPHDVPIDTICQANRIDEVGNMPGKSSQRGNPGESSRGMERPIREEARSPRLDRRDAAMPPCT